MDIYLVGLAWQATQMTPARQRETDEARGRLAAGVHRRTGRLRRTVAWWLRR
jgi:hypothetical protein